MPPTPKGERRPRPGCGWTEVPVVYGAVPQPNGVLADSSWSNAPLFVRSSLIMAELPQGGGESGPQWLVSISRRLTLTGKIYVARPKPADVTRMKRDFFMQDAEEDNHMPGSSRCFFLVCDPARRVTCECKTDETTHVDADGFTWTSPVGECSGCDGSAITGRACPIHGTLLPRLRTEGGVALDPIDVRKP